MSKQKYMPITPYFATHATREEYVSELAELDRQKAEANAGKLLLTPAERKKLEDRRRELKGLIAEIEAAEFHKPVNHARIVAQRARNGCELRRMALCDTPGHVKVTTYVDVPPNEQTEAGRRLTNELKEASAAATGKPLFAVPRPYYEN